MDLSVLLDSIPVYARAAALTIQIAAAGIVLSLVVGILCATAAYFRIPVLREVMAGYIEVSRNTPLLVQLFFLYFGLPKLGLVLDSRLCAIVGLAFLGGSYMAEAIRSGLEAIEPIQLQSALSLGMSRGDALRHVILPQALSISMPALSANVIFLVKETSVVSVVALPDLMFVAKEQIGSTYDTAEALTLLVVFYLVILLPLSLGAGELERRVRYASFGN